MKYRIRSLVFVSLSCFAVTGSAQEFAVDKDDMPDTAPEYSPYVDRYYPQRVFFGDTHHHSSFSVDSGMFGNTLGPDKSFRFARGEEVVSSNGLRVKLVRPLDFLVVSDQHRRILIEEDVRSVRPANPVLGTHNHGFEDFALLYAAVWNRLLHGHDDDVTNGREAPARASEDSNALELPRARIVGHLEGGLGLDHLTLS